jgi:hypothetical protein
VTKRIWATVVAGLFVLGAGCTGEKDVSRENIIDDLVEDAGVSTSAAECVADGIFDEFRQAEINEIDKTDSLDELDEATREKTEEIFSGCDVSVR